MNRNEFNVKQVENQYELSREFYRKERLGVPITQTERDIFNLKYMRYSIQWNSRLFRHGAISSLDRAIKLLEKELEKEKENGKEETRQNDGDQ